MGKLFNNLKKGNEFNENKNELSLTIFSILGLLFVAKLSFVTNGDIKFFFFATVKKKQYNQSLLFKL